MKVYRAVKYTYDYYEWEETLGIGITPEVLIEELQLKQFTLFHDFDHIKSWWVVGEADHKILAEKEQAHCMIVEHEVFGSEQCQS